MKPDLIYKQIGTVSALLPFSSEEKLKIKERALELSEQYINSLEQDDERFPKDIVLSSIYLSSHESGKNVSHYEIAKITGNSLSSWPRIVIDMDKRINEK